MLWAQRLLPDCQRPLEAWLRIGIPALGIVERGQVVEALADVRMLWAESLLPEGQRMFQGRLGFGILPSGSQAKPSAVQVFCLCEGFILWDDSAACR